MRLTKTIFNKENVWIFSSWVKACVHVCDHLLTPPEAREWAALIPSLKPLLESRGYFELAKRLWTGSDDAGSQEIYDEYAGQICLCLASAEGEGWHGEDYTRDRCRWSLGVNGFVALIAPGNIITAHFRDIGDPVDVKQEYMSEEEIIAKRRKDPLPRLSDWREAEDDGDDMLPDIDRLFGNFNLSVSAVERKALLWNQDVDLAVPATFEEWRTLFGRYSNAIGDTHEK